MTPSTPSFVRSSFCTSFYFLALTFAFTPATRARSRHFYKALDKIYEQLKHVYASPQSMSHAIDGSGNLNRFRDIHTETDGQLHRCNIRTRFSIKTKKELIACLIELIQERANPSIKQFGIQGLQLMQRDAGQAPNYQNVDGILADDVLAEICDIISDEKDLEIIDTAINHICEQCSDMLRTHGTCPSGRANRMFSIYSYLRDYKESFL